MRSDCVALYVDRLGPYPKLVEQWYDESRDARTYAGPLPVVAHPPCGPYGRLRHLSKNQDPTCGPRAVQQVRELGGVLEHPRDSKLWDLCGMPRPGELPDIYGGRTVLIQQCDWGHVARKETLLYVVGPIRVEWPSKKKPTHWVSGSRERRGRCTCGHTFHMHHQGDCHECSCISYQPASKGGVLPPGMKFCSAQQRRRTPVAFAEWLLELAATARPKGER